MTTPTKNTGKPSRRATLADVAAEAGVSTITVSRALRRPDIVSSKLRGRISAAVRKLGYVPDPAARAMASGRSNVIGVVIPSVTNDVFSQVISGILDISAPTPWEVQLFNTRYDAAQEEEAIRIFLGQRPAGLIVAGVDQSPEARALLQGAGCPVVQIMETDSDPVDMQVGFSHHDGARAALRHLVDAGFRRPAFLGARMDPRSHRRLEGFREAARIAEVFDPVRVVTSLEPSNVALGRELLSRLLDVAPDTDAVFCNNDDLALGVQFEALSRGIAVPDQLGICGYNDLGFMAAAHPPMTSVRTFRHRVGELATELILSRLRGEIPETAVHDLGFRLMARDSTTRSP